MATAKTVKATQLPSGQWEVRNLKTGELIATYDSAYLAKRAVQSINMSIAASAARNERW